jgi:hypothetical protein
MSKPFLPTSPDFVSAPEVLEQARKSFAQFLPAGRSSLEWHGKSDLSIKVNSKEIPFFPLL